MKKCSAVLQKKLPLKLKIQGFLQYLVPLEMLYLKRLYCDLGASINHIPLSIFKKLGLGSKVNHKTLQLADRSLKHPRGIIKDCLVKVGKFIFPTDFIILDKEEVSEILIPLGQAFLATRQALINV